MLVDPTGVNAQQGCNLRWSKDEIARPVTCAAVLNRRESVFRHRSPFFNSPYYPAGVRPKSQGKPLPNNFTVLVAWFLPPHNDMI